MEEKLFNSKFINITVINFIIYLVYYLLMVIIAVIAQEQLQATTAQAGLASGIYIIGTLIARIYVGKKLEIFGRRAVLRYGILFYLLTTIAYLAMPNMTMLYLVRFLNGAAYGTMSTATNAIGTSYIPNAKKGEGINYYGLSTSLAAGIGPFIGMLLLDKTNFYTIIVFAIALILATTIWCFALSVKEIKLSNEHRASLKTWRLSSFIEPKALFITSIAFLIGLAYSSVLAFLSSYTREIHLAAGLLLLSIVQSATLLFVTGALVGLGYGTFMSNGQAVCLKLVNEHRIGIALSTYFIGLDLGLGVGPYLLGELRNFMTYPQIYLLTGVIPILCTIMYAFFYKPRYITAHLKE